MSYSDKELYWIALAAVPGMTVKVLYTLVSMHENKEAFCKTYKNGGSIMGLNLEQRRAAFNNIVNIEELVDKMENAGVKAVVRGSEYYPPMLEEICDPPAVLFAKGELETLLSEDTFSIVGTRKSTRYGNETARRIAMELAENGVTIVSGMARGIDSMANWGALQGKGKTIAVLGCGVDVVYPPENKELYEEIIKSGVVISEYYLGTPANAHHFPIRNRIISGLSRGVLVVEAEERSGANITVSYAEQQGRDVFAVPGNVNSYASKGTNRLLKEGATFVRDASDILNEYPDWSDRGSVTLPTPEMKPMITDETELKIINILKRGETSFDELVADLKIEPKKLAVILSSLAFRGVIVDLPGNKFALDN